MCLAMNADKLVGDQLCASTSNRNFKGRQGSPTGRTVLMSPRMAAAAAVAGKSPTAGRQINSRKSRGASCGFFAPPPNPRPTGAPKMEKYPAQTQPRSAAPKTDILKRDSTRRRFSSSVPASESEKVKTSANSGDPFEKT